MIITCPECRSNYRIDPSATTKKDVRVKCPTCSHLFNISLVVTESARLQQNGAAADLRPVVLVVDDARFFREMIDDILKSLPVATLTAEDGNEAWRMICESPPRLLLLDLNIPGKSGFQILEDLQRTPVAGDMKILVMSGVERGERVSLEVSRLGAHGFLHKSFTPKELQNRVCQILGL